MGMLRKFARDERGATLLGPCLLAGLMILSAVAVAKETGATIEDLYGRLNQVLQATVVALR